MNSADPVACSNQYEPNAVLHASPFSKFRGRDDIFSFWKRIIDRGIGTVECFDQQLVIIDERSLLFSSKWRANNVYGNVKKVHWVLQPDNTLLIREDVIEFHGENIELSDDGRPSFRSTIMMQDERLPFERQRAGAGHFDEQERRVSARSSSRRDGK